jgi:ABC-2 type transport system permease protein
MAALPPRPGRFVRYLRETGLLVGRGLRAIPRVPERLSDVTIQPIMFTLLFLFLYVFGSAIHVPGSYQDYLLPGLLGQSVAFGVIGAGVATRPISPAEWSTASGRCRSPGCRSSPLR